MASSESGNPASPAVHTQSASAKGLSLHVGLNEISVAHYGAKFALDACVNDAESMGDLAKSQGFGVMNVLKDAQGTRDAVKAGMTEAAKKLNPGDFFFYTYSGHGAQTVDLDGDEKEDDKFDDKDETWCLYDGMLIDDEAYEQWKLFKPGVRVLVLLDSCHSGSAIKDFVSFMAPAALENLPKAKSFTQKQSFEVFKKNEQFYKDIQPPKSVLSAARSPAQVLCSVTLISGCQDNQLSRDGFPNSAFTAQALNVWSGGAFVGNYADFHRQVVLRLPPTQSPRLFPVGAANPEFNGQRPFTI